MPSDAAQTARVTTRLLETEEVESLGVAWDALSDAALEENAFFARGYILAGLGRIDRRSALQALAVFRCMERGGEEILIGLLPIRSTFFRYGFPVAVDLAFLNAFQTSGTPLIHRDHAVAAIDAILTAIAAGRGIARNALIEQIRRDGPVARLLVERAATAGVATAFLPAHSRPVLRPMAGSADEHFRRHLAPKRLRELLRAHRRLSEAGTLAYARVTEPTALAAAVEEFARIEASGWKGRAGTAFDSATETAAFLREAFAGGRAYADLLTVDGRAVAANLNLQTGRTAFAVKSAYDESYRKFSPGLVLEYCVIRHLFETRFADEIDSCVTEDGHVIQSLWGDVVEVGTLALRSARAWPMALRLLQVDLAALEAQRRAARATGKRLYLAARARFERSEPGETPPDRRAA
jgi:CelD/BcsL family acetyltransferase involved in cellulose biosynthesis